MDVPGAAPALLLGFVCWLGHRRSQFLSVTFIRRHQGASPLFTPRDCRMEAGAAGAGNLRLFF